MADRENGISEHRSSEPLLSIIIVNWNTRDLLSDCLASIYRHLGNEIEFDTHVVDNASEDDSVKMVRQDYPQVELIPNTENLGFVRANNQASSVARGKYLLILNSDTVLKNAGLLQILRTMEQEPDIGIATGRMTYEDGEFQSPNRRFPSTFLVFAQQTLGRINAHLVPMRSWMRCEGLDPGKPHEVDWVTGASLFMRRDLLEDGKIFDEAIFMYFEDLLLCLRARRKGYRVVYLPFGEVVHLCGRSAKQVRPTAVLYSFRSSVIYVERRNGKLASVLYRQSARGMWRMFLILFWLLRPVAGRTAKNKIELFGFLLKEEKKS